MEKNIKKTDSLAVDSASSGSVDEFLETYNVGRAVLWNAKAGQFYSRAYSASTSARLANEAFRQFKERQNTKTTQSEQ